ncbi:MAG: GGDEF domain-containing protein [Bacilli bacterium]|nr:GGDEF domain-containing protein [Bacilli bacterium]
MEIKLRTGQRLLYLQKILAWQVAKALGYQDEEESEKHGLMLFVDHDKDEFAPLMVGSDFAAISLTDDIPGWTNRYTYLLDKQLIEEDPTTIKSFWSNEGAREKYNRKQEFDSVDFVFLVKNRPTWIHAVQSVTIHEGHLCSLYWIVEIDNFKKNQSAVAFYAEHDSLTGLFNRHKLATVESEIRESYKKSVFYVFVDLDDFKHINDTYGHASGDAALVAFADKMERIFYHKRKNLIFRYGGDEFLILILDSKEETLIKALDELCTPLSLPLENGTTISLTCSAGYSDSASKADKALYKVKEEGKNGWKKEE